MARSHTPRRPWRRRQILGVALAASLLVVTPGAVWADGDEAIVQEGEPEGDDEIEAPAEGEGESGPESTSDESEGSEIPPSEEAGTDESRLTDVQGSESEPRDANRRSSDEGKILPQSLPADLAPPYVTWNVVDKDTGLPVAGAEFEIQGPRVSRIFGSSWTSNSAAVTDCVGGVCSGVDVDDDGAGFGVKSFDGHTVVSGSRYRVRPLTPPPGYAFVSTSFRDIPGAGGFNPNRSNPSPWPGDIWDFGTFEVEKLPTVVAVCEPGYVYSMQSSNGRVLEKSPSGSISDLIPASSPSSSTEWNGLGIGDQGRAIYAFTRVSRQVVGGGTEGGFQINKYDSDVGSWASVATQYYNSNFTNNRVAGAVDLLTGDYYFGGFDTSSSNNPFRVWRYSEGSGVTYVGHVNTVSSSAAFNGDIAFNASGDLFIVRGYTSGSGNNNGRVDLFTVSRTTLESANGGSLSRAQLLGFNTGSMSDVNGIAFDAVGKAYLANGTTMRSYDMPGWNNGTVVSSGLINSTDLASCSSPATITLRKNIDGGRAKAGDQFSLTLQSATLGVQTAATTGSQPGVQDAQIATPTAPGVQFSFSESFIQGAVQSDYTSRWACTVDDDTINSGSGTNGTVTVPLTGGDVVCDFVNAPLAATITLYKEVVDESGNTAPRAGWTLGVDPEIGVGALIPSQTTQETDSEGASAWRIKFPNTTSTSDIRVFEQSQNGYVFDEGVCEVSDAEGTTTSVDINDGVAGLQLEGIAPGDDVRCVFINKRAPAELTVVKKWVINDGDPIDHSSLGNHELGGALDAQLKIDDADAAWGSQPGPYAVGDEVSISETATLDTDAFPGCRLGEAFIREGSGENLLLDESFDAELSGDVTYTITNYVSCDQTLKLIKHVDNSFVGELLGAWALDAGAWDGKLTAAPEDGSPLTFDSGEERIVSDGDYTLSEGDVDGYLFEGVVCVGGHLDEATNSVSVGIGQNVVCTFTNKIAPGSVDWTKIGAEGSDPLAGSEWELRGPGDLVVPIVDVDGTGEFSVEGLPWGQYTLVETKAPAGYTKLAADAIDQFEIDGEHLTIQLGDITNVMRDVPDLPLTGGIGRDHIYIAGVLVGLLGMAAYVFTNRRRQA